jgi:hypothetical protein
MNTILEGYMEILDGLLDAGDAGQTLRQEHFPHVRINSLLTLTQNVLGPKVRMEVALPPILLLGYYHIAEVDLSSQRIFYKRILKQQEAEACTNLFFLQEAHDFVRSCWIGELQTGPIEDCTIVQTRRADNVLSKVSIHGIG